MDTKTITPVTTGGWYEHDDGTIGQYFWRSGQLHLDRTVADWGDVPTRADQEAEEASYMKYRLERDSAATEVL